MPKPKLTSAHASRHFPKGEVRQYTGEPSEGVLACHFYKKIPKDRVGQLKWRRYVRLRGATDPVFRAAFLQMCQEDLLFFANSILYVFEPRIEGPNKVLPLNTWEDQDFALCVLDECFGVRAVGVEKSRDLSLTWNKLIVNFKHWYFDSLCKMALVTETEQKVDAQEDSDSLMWKLDFLYSWLPDWMRLHNDTEILERSFTHHKFHNIKTKSTITGYACTGDVTRGGRKTDIFMDEFGAWAPKLQEEALAATQYAGNRCIISTFANDYDRFYKMMRVESSHSIMLKLICDWKDNPEKKLGLYTAIGGKLKILDKKYQFPNDYQFILDGKVRSPYYDDQCNQPGSTPQSIARELDRDPQGTSSKVFAAGVLAKARETCREPYYRGNLEFRVGDFEPIWIPDSQGRFKIWMTLDEVTGKLGYGGPYAVGCDISHGSGSSISSNSSLEVVDMRTGEQVMEFYWNMIRPVDFAQLAYVVCNWLCQGHDKGWAYLNFENQGETGGAFRNEIVRLGWANMFRTVAETKIYNERTERIGYYNRDGGYSSLCELQRGIQQDEITIRSETVVLECGQYEMGSAHGRSAGKCIHVGSKTADDPGSSGKSHGDCAIAIALAWMARCDRPVEQAEATPVDTEERWMMDFQAKLMSRGQRYIPRKAEFIDDFRHAM